MKKRSRKSAKSKKPSPRLPRETWHYYTDADREYMFKRQGNSKCTFVWQCVARIHNPKKGTSKKGKRPRPTRENWHFFGYAEGNADMERMYKHNGKCTFVWERVARIDDKKKR